MNNDYADLSRPSPVPPGTRIELIRMGDDPDPIEPGTQGTVLEGSNAAQMWIEWDNGRSLMLLPRYDRYRVIR